MVGEYSLFLSDGSFIPRRLKLHRQQYKIFEVWTLQSYKTGRWAFTRNIESLLIGVISCIKTNGYLHPGGILSWSLRVWFCRSQQHMLLNLLHKTEN